MNNWDETRSWPGTPSNNYAAKYHLVMSLTSSWKREIISTKISSKHERDPYGSAWSLLVNGTCE